MLIHRHVKLYNHSPVQEIQHETEEKDALCYSWPFVEAGPATC